MSPRLRVLLTLLLVATAWLGVGSLARAQAVDEPVPRMEEAEAIFRQALDAFEAEDYAMAYRRFRFVYEGYPLHRKTTAAILMAGKALYRDGDYQRAVDLMQEFMRAHPTSGYLAEARRTQQLAEQGLRADEERDGVLRLGIALPLNDEDVGFSQALFNGIRLAVETHNRSQVPPVQMVFRDTRNSARGAQAAVAELAGEVDVVIGPLYSAEAEAAAEAAERAGVVLVAPLATDASVSDRRRYVFQANPTIASRGVLMARLAVTQLGLRRLGVAVVPDRSQISEQMAEGFMEEARRLGADVTFYERMASARAWSDLPDRVGVATLESVDAVYLPIAGSAAQRGMADVLSAFERVNVLPWVLGDKSWHDAPSRQQATLFSVTYTDDFFVNADDAGVQAFDRSYRTLAGEEPGRLAYVGYDVTRFLLNQLTLDDGEPLHQRLHEAMPYSGLGMDIDFRAANANEALFFLQYRNNEVVRYR